MSRHRKQNSLFTNTLQGPPIYYKNISWKDFHSSPDHESTFLATTYWHINYNFRVFKAQSFAYISIQISCNITPRSWVKLEKATDELLKHEQGHYDLGVLCAAEFKKRVEMKRFSLSRYKIEIESMFQLILRQYQQLEILYDEETDHFRNKEMQEKWNAILEEALREIKAQQSPSQMTI